MDGWWWGGGGGQGEVLKRFIILWRGWDVFFHVHFSIFPGNWFSHYIWLLWYCPTKIIINPSLCISYQTNLTSFLIFIWGASYKEYYYLNQKSVKTKVKRYASIPILAYRFCFVLTKIYYTKDTGSIPVQRMLEIYIINNAH